MYGAALVIWAIFLMVAIFYTRRARHPKTAPLAGYLLFVTVFSVCAFVLFACLSTMMYFIGFLDWLKKPVFALHFLAAVFLPAFFIARWQLRKPPQSRMPR